MNLDTAFLRTSYDLHKDSVMGLKHKYEEFFRKHNYYCVEDLMLNSTEILNWLSKHRHWKNFPSMSRNEWDHFKINEITYDGFMSFMNQVIKHWWNMDNEESSDTAMEKINDRYKMLSTNPWMTEN